MLIDVVIATYRRPEKVAALVTQLLACLHPSSTIIVVDSSDEINSAFMDQHRVKYIRSTHKNQPYQRYVGYLISSADLLLYLDDDMEIIDSNLILPLFAPFETETDLAGIAFHFTDKHVHSSLSKMPNSIFFSQKQQYKKIINWFTGYKIPATGKLGLCGIRGPQPKEGGITEWLSGGAFAAQKKYLFKNFNFQLLDLFEEKMGMGEDAIIGYGLSKQGKLIYNPNLLFYHNDQADSTYSTNTFHFSKRIIFSRLFLSLEKTRLDGENYFRAWMHYYWYTGWRLMGMLGNYLCRPNMQRKEILTGTWIGCKMASHFTFDVALSRTQYWMNEAKKNIEC